MPQTFEFNRVGETLIPFLPKGARFKDVEPAFMDSLLLANDVPRGGVIHLGASRGQEAWLYTLLGFPRAVMAEPVPDEFARLTELCAGIATYTQAQRRMIGEGAREPIEFHCVECAVSDQSGTSTFFQTEQTTSSSLSRPMMKTEDGRWDAVEIEVETRTLDDLMRTLPDGWAAEDFTYLRMNVQGSEMRALRGGEQVLRQVRGIFLEVNLLNRYQDEPAKEDFDRFLGDFGFESTFGMASPAVGNVFYRRA